MAHVGVGKGDAMCSRLIVALFLVLVSSGVASDEASRSQSQSLSLVRMQVEQRRLVPASAIRADEWINYLDYDFPRLKAQDGVGVDLLAAMRVQGGEPDWSAMLMIVLRTAPHESVREQPVDLVIVLDRSGSMAEARKMDYAQQAIRFLTKMLQPGDRVGLVGFDNEVSTERTLLPWKVGENLDAELRRLMPRGSTNMNLGLQTGMQMLLSAPAPGDPPDGPERARRLLVITDAITNTGEVNVEKIVQGLTPGFDKGVRMSCIGVGVSYNDGLLSPLCRIPGNNGRFLDKPEEIQKSMVELCDALLPLELDKPRMTLRLPAGVRVENSYGTPIEQQGEKVTFPKLTSLGADDHEIVCLRLGGAPQALKRSEDAGVEVSAYSPARKAHVALSCPVDDVSDVDDATLALPGYSDSARGRLTEALRKAGVVAESADALRCAALAAENRDWAQARMQVRRAEAALGVYGSAPAGTQIAQIRHLVALNREVLKEIDP